MTETVEPVKADINWVDKECRYTEWRTPEKILAPARAFFGGRILLDPATDPSNPTNAIKFFTESDNGLIQDWDVPWFVNCPYGNGIRNWTAKIYKSSRVGGIALLPCGARFSTRYWQADILNEYLYGVCFVKGRVSFIGPDGKPAKGNRHDSAIYAYGPDRSSDFGKLFSPLGKTFIGNIFKP